VSIAGNTARSWSTYEALTHGGLRVTGSYFDELVRVTGSWRIARRVVAQDLTPVTPDQEPRVPERA
jgi:hypothetical protein